MKFFGILVVTILVVVFVNPFLPYWAVMVILFVIAALLKPGNSAAFWGGGFGMALSWIGLSLYLTINSGSDLPDRMAQIIGAPSGTVLMAVTGVIGFLLGGFSSLSGNLFRNLIKRRPTNIYRG